MCVRKGCDSSRSPVFSHSAAATTLGHGAGGLTEDGKVRCFPAGPFCAARHLSSA